MPITVNFHVFVPLVALSVSNLMMTLSQASITFKSLPILITLMTVIFAGEPVQGCFLSTINYITSSSSPCFRRPSSENLVGGYLLLSKLFSVPTSHLGNAMV